MVTRRMPSDPTSTRPRAPIIALVALSLFVGTSCSAGGSGSTDEVVAATTDPAAPVPSVATTDVITSSSSAALQVTTDKDPGSADGVTVSSGQGSTSTASTDTVPTSSSLTTATITPSDSTTASTTPSTMSAVSTTAPSPSTSAATTPTTDQTSTTQPTTTQPTTLPPGIHPDIVRVIEVAGRNPGGDSWKDSYSVGNQCYCATTFDHGIGTVVVDTPAGPKTVREVCEKLGPGPGPQGRPIYNDIQCGNGPANDAGDETDCPGRVDIGRDGCGHVGPRWDLSAFT